MTGQLADLAVGALELVAAVAGHDNASHFLAVQTAVMPQLRQGVRRAFCPQTAQLQAFGHQLFTILQNHAFRGGGTDINAQRIHGVFLSVKRRSNWSYQLPLLYGLVKIVSIMYFANSLTILCGIYRFAV